MTRDDAEACGWRVRLLDSGRRWVARKRIYHGELVDDVSFANHQLENVLASIERWEEQHEPAAVEDSPPGPFSRAEAACLGWSIRPHEIAKSDGRRYASGWSGYGGFHRDGRKFLGDSAAEVLAGVAALEGRSL